MADKHKSATSSACQPCINMSKMCPIWRMLNLAMAIFFSIGATAQIYSNSDDWWVSALIFALPGLISSAIVIRPQVVNDSAWRLLCANVIIFGTIYLFYLFWIVRDVASYGYIQNPVEFEEGRKCAILAVAVTWAVICRLTANVGGALHYIRLLTLGGIIIGCVPLLAWSLCFYSTGWEVLPYCKYLFITGDKD